MNCDEVSPGIRVKVTKLGTADGMIVPAYYKMNRRKQAIGFVTSAIPGHGGEVWFVKHQDDKVAPYSFDELERADEGDVDIEYEFAHRLYSAEEKLKTLRVGGTAHGLVSMEVATWTTACQLIQNSRILEE